MSQLAPLLRRAADILDEVGDRDRADVYADSAEVEMCVDITWWAGNGNNATALCRSNRHVVWSIAPGIRIEDSDSPPPWFIEFLDEHFPKEEGK